MLFNSYDFILVFLPALLAGVFFLHSFGRRWLEVWLILGSLLFYAWWDVRFLPLLLGSVVVNYLAALLIERTRSRLVLAGIIAANLALLGFYKYLGFFSQITSNVLAEEAPWNLTLLALVLPLGISFYTFQQIGYQVDRWRGHANRHDFLDYLLFVTFFPQLIAGPIVRLSEFLPQLRRFAERLSAQGLLIGLTIFSIGLFKKVILADTFALYATPVFDAASEGVKIDSPTAWLGVLSYTFQIYFDFSGYTDMAIGLARMMGIDLPINFNAPYRSLSISDFWRRWHITLGRFLRDYLYIPLGGSRVGPLRQIANLMAVMLLCGLWHGAGWTFVVWGGLHGAALVAHRLWQRLPMRLPQGLVGRSIAWGATFGFVVVSWVFFRADTMSVAFAMLRSMTSLGSLNTSVEIDGLSAVTFGWSAVVFATVWVLVAPTTHQLMRLALRAPMYRPYMGWALLRPSWRATPGWVMGSAAVFAVAFLGLSRVSEFIYYNF